MIEPIDSLENSVSMRPKTVSFNSKGERSRQRLIDCSRRVFEDKGFTDTRITDIASSADMAVGSFYTYFNSKEAIFLALVRQVNNEMFPDPRTATAELPDSEIDVKRACEKIERANRHFIEFYRQNWKLNATIESAATHVDAIRKYRQQLRRRSVESTSQSIVQLQRAKVADPTLQPQITAAALVSMVSNFAYFWFVYNQDFDSEEAVRHLNMIWARALGFGSFSFNNA